MTKYNCLKRLLPKIPKLRLEQSSLENLESNLCTSGFSAVPPDVNQDALLRSSPSYPIAPDQRPPSRRSICRTPLHLGDPARAPKDPCHAESDATCHAGHRVGFPQHRSPEHSVPFRRRPSELA